MGNGAELHFCGTRLNASELEMIRETISDCAGLSRTELAYTICELLEWRRPNGSLKGHECRLFLERLESNGILRLPARKGNGRTSKPSAVGEGTDVEPAIMSGKLSEVGPVTLELVETRQQQRQWREYVDRYHYLGCKVPFGGHLRYFVHSTRPQPQKVGCLQVSSPAWRMAARDQWIGWDDSQRLRGLQRIVQNSRFLILPWVRVHCLASSALSVLARRVGEDWEARYAVKPVLMETLVDPARFRGTCYRAANWLHLGQTSGRGRMDRGHERHGASPKDVLVYPLCRKAREKLLEV
ncbi:MAG: DUF4338 domain-containing protein [Syntrophobacteraceae bacterium]